jgi:tetraacyldisaccharide 4'-kinase
MLARALPGVAVLVCPDRYLAGRLAERQLNCTVLLLDDGFQHLPLGRQVDVLVMPASDLDESVLPNGRLREGLDAACSADCLLVPGSDDEVSRVAAAFQRTPVFRVTHRYHPLRGFGSTVAAGKRVVAVAGLGRPVRFFTALRELGYEVVRELPFPDHHWYSTRDLDRIRAVAREISADLVVTTEKDAVRLPAQSHPSSTDVGVAGWAVLPMTAAIEPADRFTSWLRERV